MTYYHNNNRKVPKHQLKGGVGGDEKEDRGKEGRGRGGRGGEEQKAEVEEEAKRIRRRIWRRRKRR